MMWPNSRRASLVAGFVSAAAAAGLVVGPRACPAQVSASIEYNAFVEHRVREYFAPTYTSTADVQGTPNLVGPADVDVRMDGGHPTFSSSGNAYQSDFGFSALGLFSRDAPDWSDQHGHSHVRFSMTVINENAASLPLSLPFHVVQTSLRLTDNTPNGLNYVRPGQYDQAVSSIYSIRAERSVIGSPNPPTRDAVGWTWTTALYGGAGSVHLGSSMDILNYPDDPDYAYYERNPPSPTDPGDPQRIGFPQLDGDVVAGGDVRAHYHEFLAKLDFAPLAPQEIFTLYYDIEFYSYVSGIAATSINNNYGVSAYGGDPFELIAGNPAGAGSAFELHVGDQVFGTLTPFPEPGLLSLLALSSAAGLLRRRRRPRY